MLLDGSKFDIKVIDHKDQRYETCGDWWLDNEGVWHIRVSDMGNPAYENLVIIHEMNEIMIAIALLPPDTSFHQLVAQVDRFDKRYENNRHPADDFSEPGYVPACPVYKPHMIASAIEHMVAAELNVDFNLYGDAVASLKK